MTTAVVLVSGGGAITPYTTPDRVAASGLAAGGTVTRLREVLLDAGHTVFSAPATIGPGPVTGDPDWFGGFTEPPQQPPAELTVNSIGDLDTAGRHLAAFLGWLADEHGVRTVHVVAHSMGGLFSTAAIGALSAIGNPVEVRSLTALGTPWEGSFAGDHVVGAVPLEVALGEQTAVWAMKEAVAHHRKVDPTVFGTINRGWLCGPDGWHARRGDTLAGVRVTLVAGDVFRVDGGDPAVWPHDGIVQRSSARAEHLPTEALAPAAVHTVPDAHSIFYADRFGLPWERGLTWDPEVAQMVLEAISLAG